MNGNGDHIQMDDVKGHLNASKADVKGHLNKGKEEEMEVIGYEASLPRKSLTFLGYVLTAGLLRLAFHWWPQLHLYCTHRRCSLEKATKVLVVDVFEKRFKSLFVKDVRIISTSREKPSLQNGSKTGWHPSSPTVYLADGSKKEMETIRLINVKKLNYVWIEENSQFVGLVGLDNGQTKENLCEFRGCSEEERTLRQTVYGKNYIEAPIQSYLTLILLEFLNPFYVFQVFSLIIWFSDEYYYYGVAIIIMSVFGISTSVVQTHKNQKTLHETINQIDTVSVRRPNGVLQEVFTTELVPGDIIVVSQGAIACCDALLLHGSCVVNESMLTGESVPVTKSFVRKNNQKLNLKEDAAHILFCGTEIIQTKKPQGDVTEVEALVLRTGFLTSKGSLVRSILYPPPADYKFDTDSYKLIYFLAIMGLSGTIFTAFYKASENKSLHEIIIRALDLLTITIPVALPATMTVGKIYALGRLKKQKISCINPRVVNVSGSINCICFDKTGTLTEDGMDMLGVLPAVDGHFSVSEPTNAEDLTEESRHFLFGMASCHSLSIINCEINGDPLELKMFEATGWTLEEPEFCSNKSDTAAIAIARPRSGSSQSNEERLEVLHQFQFSSKLKRMSVIVRKSNGEMAVFCKGSPEAIISLSQPMTIPEGTMTRLKQYTMQGYRVIAMAWKPVPPSSYHHIVDSSRDELEKDLRFEGFIIMENKLKSGTKPTIKELQDAKMKVVMITGDNILTAVCVAKDCGILGNRSHAAGIDVNESGQLFWHDLKSQEPGNDIANKHDVKSLLETSLSRDYEIATTGDAWARIRESWPGLVPKLVESGAVFARMGPDQKQQVIVEIMNLGFVVAMCGDGANDCGALKAANVGISLSEAEASVASPFTSQIRDISCVLSVIREGRAALVTAFGICKFMVLYSCAEFFSTIILYTQQTNLTDFQFLFIDIFLIINFAFLFGREEAYKGPIVPQTPLSTLISPSPILSMILHAIVILVFQLISLAVVKKNDWFEPYTYVEDKIFASYENYAVYAVSQFQYITLAIIFSQSHPYRERIIKNKIFSASLLLMTSVCIYLTVYPKQWLINLFEFRFPPSEDFPWTVVGLGAASFTVSLFIEMFVIEYLIERKLKFVQNALLKGKLISRSELV